MSTLSLDPDEFRTLESLRQRLATLTANLRSLETNVLHSSPLPPPSSLQASARIAQQNLSSLQTLLADQQELLTRLAVHPSTNYPGRTHEVILQGLLRKKLEPGVEEWVEKARDVAVGAGVEAGKIGQGRKKRGEDEEEEEEEDDEGGYRPEEDDDGDGGNPLHGLWEDVRDALGGRVREFVQEESHDVYTAEEREVGVERVRTGLKRDLEEEMEDEDEESDDDEDGDGDAEGKREDEDVVMLGAGGAPPGKDVLVQQKMPEQGPPSVPLEQMLWFMGRGDDAMPGNIETEAARKAKAAKGGNKGGMRGRGM